MIGQIIIILFLTFSSIHADNSELTISSGFSYPETNLVEAILKEGFKRANVKLNYQTLPNQRSLFNANNGINDGEGARINGINVKYKNLLRVNVSTYSIDLVIISKKRIFIKNLSDLKEYNVGIIRGMLIAENLIQDLSPRSTSAVTNHETLIKMLLNDRLDVVITNKIGFFSHLPKESSLFYIRKEPILSLELYMHLHKKNLEMIPKFEKAFQTMIDDGTYQKIKDKFVHDIEAKFRNTMKLVEYE